MRFEMTGRFSQVLLAVALVGAGPAAGSLAAQSAPPAGRKLEFLVGGGLGFGSSGIHQTERGDSKPGEYLAGRLGLARGGRPFLVADVEWQPFKAPAANPPGTPAGQPKTEFSAVSLLAGVAIYPVADMYLMPRIGAQFRSWAGPDAEDFSESGLATGLDVGYHLPFGENFSLSPEVFLRYSVIEGPDSPSHRGFGLRLMAHWRR
jgi:hypothetical protein